MWITKSLRIVSKLSEYTKILKRNHSNGLSYFHNSGRYPLVYRTIGQELSRAVSVCGDRDYVVGVEENKTLTYEQLKKEADTLAAGLQCLGLKKGDRLGIWAPSVVSWPVALFAAARAGLILVALNPAYVANEMEYCLKKVGVKTLIASENFRSQDNYETLLKIIPELSSSNPRSIRSKKIPSLESIVIDSDKKYEGTFRLSDIKSMPTVSQVNCIEDQQKDINPDSASTILFTSGTTGQPKAALLKHSAIVNSSLNLDRIDLKNRKILLHVPFFHVFGMSLGLMGTLSHQATIVLPSKLYNPEKSLLTIRNEKCSVVYGTPTMFLDLVHQQKAKKLDINVEICLMGAAPSPPQLFREIKKELGYKSMIAGYGMTEGSGASYLSLQGDTDKQIFETVGYTMDHLEVKVIDKMGKMVPFGTPGELCMRGQGTMIGYWNDEKKTSEVLGKDGWLRTGDQFVLQPDGYASIVGRLKEIIIRGGENLFPKEIEDFLATYPQICEVHVIGVPDKRLGEEVCAYVRLKPGTETFSEDDIRKFCKGKIADYKIPKYFEIIKEFPKTGSGKVQKFRLQEMFKDKQACKKH